MTTYAGAQITIGGALPSDLVSRFCELIRDADTHLEWASYRQFCPYTSKDLLDAVVSDYITLGTGAAPDDAFTQLEAWLRRHAMPYERTIYGQPGVVSRHRPGYWINKRLLDHDETSDVITVPKCDLYAAMDKLRAGTTSDGLTFCNTQELVRTALALLESMLPTEWAPFTPFSIVHVP